MRSSFPSRLSARQAWAGAALGMLMLAALVALYAPAPYGVLSEQTPLPQSSSRAAPASIAPPQPPAARSTVAARLTDEEAIRLVSSRPMDGQPDRTLAEAVASRWTAEYRGDGTWLVRAGEPAWLLMEDRREAMPVNVAAINLQ